MRLSFENYAEYMTMRLLSIELAGYRRLKTDTVALFRMELVQKIQLILGSNGTGKSALLSELTPFPADGSHFHKGGYKLIKLEKNGNLYELKNEFSTKAGRHSFLKNGEELNQEGLQSSQMELVWNEFKINKKIRELALGKRVFTDMRPMERREWLTLLADTDFEYALEVHGKLKDKLRDADRDVRRDQGRLTVETSKIITQDERDRLQKDVKEIHEELSQLLSVRKPIERSSDTLAQHQDAGLAKLNEMSSQLLKMRLHAPFSAYGAEDPSRNEWGELESVNFKSIEDVEEHLSDLRQRAAAEEALIKKSVADHHKLQQNLEVLKKTGQEGLKSLSVRFNNLLLERGQLLDQRKYKIEVSDPQLAMAALDAIHDTLFSVFNEIPENEDKRFSQAIRNEVQTELARDRETAYRYKNYLGKLEGQAEHYAKHLDEGGVGCPKCGHHFVPGYTADGLKDIKEKIAQGTTSLREVEERIKKLEERLGELDRYAGLVRQYHAIRQSQPVLAGLWDYLESRQHLTHSPRAAVPVFTLFREDLVLELRVKALGTELDTVKELMEQKTLVGDVSLSETQDKIDELVVSIEAMTAHLSRLQTRYAQHLVYRNQLEMAYQIGEKIENLKENLIKLTTDYLETIWMETVHHCIQQLQTQLANKEGVLREAQQQLQRVQELEQSIRRSELDKKALEKAVDILSPKDGLIAEGLMGFIRNFVRKMNQVIARVWTTPLVVKECAVGDDGRIDLDYKFPMLVNNKLNVDDVEEGSGAQKDIVNLAFMVVALKYLHLADGPLVLDEFEEHFDKAHQMKAVETVKAIIDTQSFSQLLMISHFEATYTAYSNVDICVLDEKNIAVPDVYNQHVLIQ